VKKLKMIDLWDEIIKSKRDESPEEVREILCEAMGVKSLRLLAVLKFLYRQGVVNQNDLKVIGLYLILENLLEK